MKRRMMVACVAVLAAAACSDQQGGVAGPTGADEASPWVRPPQIDGVMRDGGVLVLRGGAGPNARVVLRAPDTAAVATTADGAGRFELRLPPLSGDVRFTPEVQVGEDAAVSPETLVVIQGGSDPVALIAAGQPTVRLDGGEGLDAVDSDGATLMVSGRTSGAAPSVNINGADMSPTAIGRGRWRAVIGQSGAAKITVNGKSFDYPGAGEAAGFVVERAGAGWRITWPVEPAGRQTTWLPD
ncbi:hypothetical protein [Brevundimonas sp. C43]|uniref:hypothetical protein n=1 Tax=Brevundimonas sp. C43 TaxID=3068314 RepID=UPI00273FFFD5|nr:hypothetical protein [Brevundimonas sp. C43]